MNKRVFFIWSICLLAIVPLLAGCDKDEEENYMISEECTCPCYAEIEDEHIVSEITEVPGFVYQYFGQYVFISYAEHAEEFFKNIREFTDEERDEIYEKAIGVLATDFDKYRLSIGNRVYVSAYITNNHERYIDPHDIDPYWGGSYLDEAKAYLINLRIRY